MAWFDAANPHPSTTTLPTFSLFRGPFRLRIRFWFLVVASIIVAFAIHRCAKQPSLPSMARVYADVNQHMPRAYWDYDSVNISWGVLENYEVVRKIGAPAPPFICCEAMELTTAHRSWKILRGL